ncbi:MAG: DUF6311 domain-containing protein [Neptuniibacter sp.]
MTTKWWPVLLNHYISLLCCKFNSNIDTKILISLFFNKALAQEKTVTLIAAIASGLFAWVVYNPIVNPMDIGWLKLSGDAFQHYIGWHFFRNESWGWPIGNIENIATDLHASIVFTDSIPLVALPLKLLTNWLPSTFQYQGLWMLLSFTLNGFFAVRLLYRLNVSPLNAFIGGLLICCSSIVATRGLGMHGHEALVAHWLIFLAIEYTLLLTQGNMKNFMRWAALLLIAVLIHFYLFFMVGVFWTTWLLHQAFRTLGGSTSKLSIQAIIPLLWCGVLTPLLVIFIMYCVGYFQLDRDFIPGGGFGYFSAEALTYFNAGTNAWFINEDMPSMSSWLGGWKPPIGGQYEGASYVGLGVLLLWLFALILWLRNMTKGANQYILNFTVVLIAGGGLFFYALAGKLSFPPDVIVQLHPDAAFGPLKDYLRSSGRMAWPLAYVLTFISLVIFSRYLKPSITAPVLIILLLVQYLDIIPVFNRANSELSYRVETVRKDPQYYDVLKDQEMIPIWKAYNRFVAFPAQNISDLAPFIWVAAEYEQSLNVAYLANQNSVVIEQAVKFYIDAFERGELTQDQIYLITDSEMFEQVCKIETWSCRLYRNVGVVWPASKPRAVSGK